MDSSYLGGDLDGPLTAQSKPVRQSWWLKPELYKNEKKLFDKIPLWRTVLSICMIYGFYIGVDFCASLCTTGLRFICSVSLIAAVVYFFWALWWDEPVIIPPTLTFFHMNEYYSFSSLMCICYETTLIATAVLIVVTSMMFTYVELEDIFTWNC